MVRQSPAPAPLGIGRCAECGGVVTLRPVPRSVALSVVFFDQFGQSERDANGWSQDRYFDLEYVDDRAGRRERVHGWFNTESRLMTQSG